MVTMETRYIFWNCSNGLFGKIGEVRSIISEHKPWAMFVSESEIKNDALKSACEIANYTLHLSSGFEHGNARVACYVKDSIQATRKNEIEGVNLECIAIDFMVTGIRERVIGFYNPFKIPPGLSRLNYTNLLLETLGAATATESGCIFGGDMNIDVNKTSPLQERLSCWLAECTS
jgi:exonuclease III